MNQNILSQRVCKIIFILVLPIFIASCGKNIGLKKYSEEDLKLALIEEVVRSEDALVDYEYIGKGIVPDDKNEYTYFFNVTGKVKMLDEFVKRCEIIRVLERDRVRTKPTGLSCKQLDKLKDSIDLSK